MAIKQKKYAFILLGISFVIISCSFILRSTDSMINQISKAENEAWNQLYTYQCTFNKTGADINVSGCVVYHLKDDKIVEVWNFEDLLGLYIQM